MGYMGDTDDDDVRAKVLDCRQKGLSDFLIDGQSRTVRAFAADPLTDRQFYMMLSGASGPDDFTFAEVIDGRARDVDGQYVDVDVPATWAQDTSINDFLEIVGGEMDDAFWDTALASFLGLYRTIDAAITTALHHAEYQQGERMTSLCEEARTEEPADSDSEARFQAFTEACRRRAPFAETITVEFPDHTGLFDDLVMDRGAIQPRVCFGYRLGQDDGEVAYLATGIDDSQENLYLNGWWTRPERLEENLLEAYTDPWDRFGARNAARDLLAIQSTVMEFLRAEHAKASKRLDDQRALLAFEVFGGYEPRGELEAFDRSRDGKLREQLSGPIRRVEEYLERCGDARGAGLP